MRYCSVAPLAGKGCLILIACLALAWSSPVGAVQSSGESRIEVLVCPTGSQSAFVPTQPQSDSVVNAAKLNVTGTVAFISQIDFFIDEVYNNTVALGYSATTFDTHITLSPGTHTIKLVATDSCSQTVHTEELVVTYQPKTEPSVGEEVVTEVENTVRNPPVQNPAEPITNPILDIIDRTITPPVVAVADSLNILPSEEANEATRIADTVRTVLFAAGLTVTLAAAHATSMAVLPESFKFLQHHLPGGVGMIAFIGVGLMVLVFLL